MHLPTLRKFVILFTYLPFAWVVLLHVTALNAYYLLGHFPLPCEDDPKTIFSFPWQVVPLMALFAFFQGCVFWLLLLPRLIIIKMISFRRFCLTLAGSIFSFAYLHTDPFSLLAWILD